MIGNTYGSLVVIGFDRDSDTAIVKCKCNNVEGYFAPNLTSGDVRQCRKCERRCEFVMQIRDELILDQELDRDPERAKGVVGELLRHLEERWMTARSASFTKFVDALMADEENAEPSTIEKNICRSITSSIRRTGMRSAGDYVSNEQTTIANGAERQTTSPIR